MADVRALLVVPRYGASWVQTREKAGSVKREKKRRFSILIETLGLNRPCLFVVEGEQYSDTWRRKYSWTLALDPRYI